MASSRRQRHRHRDHAPALEPPGITRPFDRRGAVVLFIFAIALLTIGASAYVQSSATWDEPMHLTAGYAAAARQDFRIDPSHPPLLRMWAALPALFMDDVEIETASVDAASPEPWLSDAYGFAHRFIYVDHDADRMLYRARFMILLLGVPLGGILFLWTREWLGFWPAVLALVFYTLEPNLLAHASLVTTDFGVTCFVFAAVYFLWRAHVHGGGWNVAGLTVCSALAVLAKFSGLLLAPIVALLLAVAVARSQMTTRRAIALAAIAAAGVFVSIWAAYGFRYLPSASDAWVFALDRSSLAEHAPVAAGIVRWIDAYRLLPNAFTQGLFYTQASVAQMPAFLAGEIRTGGWWYYFPAAFLLKTPLVLLLLGAAGIVTLIRRPPGSDGTTRLFIVVPLLAFLGVAMASGVNLGLRHILPVYPFVVMLAAAGASEALRARRTIAIAALAVVLIGLPLEFASAYPHPLTFFNQLAGGPGNGYRHLADSNLSWGQGLKGLKAWMERNGVAHVNLAYFGQADPAYYRIDCTYLPGAPSFAIDATARPRLPGYVAISATTLSGVYSRPEWRLFYQPFFDRQPAAVIGNSIRVYWVEDWPDVADDLPDGIDAGALRQLADAMLFGLQWPAQAVRVYETYLRRHADDTDARVNHATALIGTDRLSEGMDALRHAAATGAQHARAQLTLARALYASGDLAGAVHHGERAVALDPDDADAQHLRGRVRAAQGDAAGARQAFTRALQIDPGHAGAQRDLARLQQAPGTAGGAAVRTNPR